MLHGNKKKEKKELTEEETKKLDAKIQQIKELQTILLDKRHNKEMKEENLILLTQAAHVLPDFSTLWAYRKEILLHIRSTKNDEEYTKTLINEINQTTALMKSNPKSYILWYHRIWCLNYIAEIEKKERKNLSNSHLMNEIGLCNLFFEKDNRNFHCWNYRLLIFKMIYQYFPENFWEFVNKELPFTINMISKSFSNFSAWHYRSKLIPLFFENKNIDWNSKEAFDFFNKDLDFITNAINTDPKDQSPWNYHYWIINNLIPIYVK
jgi:geranylgeranyl transferase type-2 subunit alpha